MISEVGLAGAGKTTALVQLCGKNAFLVSEQKREPTEDEKKAWHSDEPVSTSWYPNFGSIILRFNTECHKFEIDQEAGQVGEGEYLINIILGSRMFALSCSFPGRRLCLCNLGS